MQGLDGFRRMIESFEQSEVLALSFVFRTLLQLKQGLLSSTVAAILGVSWCPESGHPKICPRGCPGMVGHHQDLATLIIIIIIRTFVTR